MRRIVVVSMATVALASGVVAYAQDHMDHQKHMTDMADDGRQFVNFPPEMRQHILANMRDHRQVLSDILTAMSSAQYAKAARIADAQLGMVSPSAESCKGGNAAGAPQMSKPATMDHQMSQFMPEGMRKIGLEMHQSASDFAIQAAKASTTGNAKPALAALSCVVEQCTACHVAYRVQQ